MEELFSIARVAEYLGVSERTVYDKVRTGELPALKVGRLWRVRRGDLEEWLSQRSGHERPSGEERRGPYPHSALDVPLPMAREGAGVPTRGELSALLEPISDTLGRRLAFVGLLVRGVEALGWPAPVVVGGNAVEFYTAGDYPTVDVDLAGASEPVAEVLDSWGFEREGRHFYDEELNLLVEVPGGTLPPDRLGHVAEVRIAGVTAYILGIEDLIIDRLAACAFRQDAESCRWAAVLLAGAPELDLAYLKRRAAEEDLEGPLMRLREEGPA
ncbi:MAG: helix-turn-helix domain-containing protein [Coriobacteriia bacterium]|nr:helix-turn-helix domain-containing protein [Coriobacteriia bacterium]